MNKKIILLVITAYVLFLFAIAWKNTGEAGHPGRYTEKDIFIKSYECGYLGSFPTTFIMIENKEQSDYMEQHYSMSQNSYFQEMKSQYPLTDYTYLILYESFDQGGYSRHVNGIEISGDGPHWIYDVYKSPKGDRAPAVMVGFMHMTAIPKEYLDGCDFIEQNYLYPGENLK